jgi:hypothetical protein
MSFNITIDPVKAAQKRNEQVEASRKAAYLSEADPLFFKAQRGEIPITAWQQKVAEIKSRFPKE